jgi:hypothetical protein
MKLKPKYTIPVLWVIIIFCFLMAISCVKKEKYPSKLDTIAKALSNIEK